MGAQLTPTQGKPWTGRTLVGVFAHPDDESYSAAGTLALCAAGGARVQLVCLTRGEAGLDLSGAGLTGSALGDKRVQELHSSCAALACSPPILLDLPDGELKRVAPQSTARLLAQRLEHLEPDALLTLGWDGVYGHVDHRACTSLVQHAWELLPPGGRLLHCQFPEGLFAELARRLLRFRKGALYDQQAPSPPGTPAQAVDLRADIRTWAQQKLSALRAHGSQLPGGDPDKFLEPGLIQNLLKEEWFTLQAGPELPQGASDPFGGLF